jgi:hypothetical protein
VAFKAGAHRRRMTALVRGRGMEVNDRVHRSTRHASLGC